MIWKRVKSIFGGTVKKNEAPNTLTNNKDFFYTDMDKAEHLNEFYSSIANKIKSKLRPSEKDFKFYLNKTNKNLHSIFLKSIVIEEIEVVKIIKSLEVKKAKWS